MEDINLQYAEMIKSSSEFITKYFISSFKDPLIEKNYLTHIQRNLKSLRILYFFVYIITYFFLCINGFITTKNSLLIYINSIFLVITITLAIVYYITESPHCRSLIEISCLVLKYIDLAILIYILIKEKHEEKIILQHFYYLIVYTVLSLFIWSKTIFFVWLIFNISNGVMMVSYELTKDQLNEITGFDIFVKILGFFISYWIKKFYDSVVRINFLQKIKLEKFFDYNKKLIYCMSGLHITFGGNRLIYMNDNVNYLLDIMWNNSSYEGNFFI